MLRQKDVVDSYDVLMRRQQKLLDAMVNAGRQKDYEVQKVEKKWDSVIDDYIRQIHATELRIKLARDYVTSTSVDKADIATKAIKKED